MLFRSVAFQRWTVFLVDWSDTESSALEEATNRIIWAFPNSDVQRLSVPRSIGPFNQMRIEITTNPAVAAVVASSRLLLEDGSFLLLEDGGYLLLES